MSHRLIPILDHRLPRGSATSMAVPGRVECEKKPLVIRGNLSRNSLFFENDLDSQWGRNEYKFKNINGTL